MESSQQRPVRRPPKKAKVNAPAGAGGKRRARDSLVNVARQKTRKAGNVVISALSRFEGGFHKLLQEFPVVGPLGAAIICVALLVIPQLQPAEYEPRIFQAAIFLIVLAAVGWMGIQILNDIVHSRYGLLPPQRRTVVLGIALFGGAFFIFRCVHLYGFSRMGTDAMSTERLQRLLMGGLYVAFRFFGLDMWG